MWSLLEPEAPLAKIMLWFGLVPMIEDSKSQDTALGLSTLLQAGGDRALGHILACSLARLAASDAAGLARICC